MSQRFLLKALALSSLALAACGNSGGKPAPAFGTEGALYAVSTGVSNGDEFIGYLALVDSIEPGASFDLSQGFEIEPSWIFGQKGRPYVYAASLIAPTITRYDLHDDGTFEPGATVSFANYGVSSAYFAASAPFYSDEKSYFVDDAQDQVVIWSPSRMEVLGTIPLGNDPENGLPPAPEGSMVLHDGLLLTAVDWSDWMVDSTVYGPHTRLLAIDPKTDSVVERTDDERLTFAQPSDDAKDHTVYYSPGSLISAYAELGEGHGSPSNVVRVVRGEGTFDPEYQLDLRSLTGGRPAGDYVRLDEKTAAFRVWHPELVDPIEPTNWEEVLWSQAGFLWWRLRDGETEAEPIADQEPGTLGASFVHVDGKTYVVRTAADSTSSTLDELTPNGEIRPGLTGPGQFIGNAVVRLR